MVDSAHSVNRMQFQPTMVNVEKQAEKKDGARGTGLSLLKLINAVAFIAFAALASVLAVYWVASLPISPLLVIAVKRSAIVFVATALLRGCCGEQLSQFQAFAKRTWAKVS